MQFLVNVAEGFFGEGGFQVRLECNDGDQLVTCSDFRVCALPLILAGLVVLVSSSSPLESPLVPIQGFSPSLGSAPAYKDAPV